MVGRGGVDIVDHEGVDIVDLGGVDVLALGGTDVSLGGGVPGGVLDDFSSMFSIVKLEFKKCIQ